MASMSEYHNLYPYKVDLTNCESEPLHHIQVIQSYSCLVVCDKDTFLIRHVSENVEDFVGLAPAALLGQSIAYFLPQDIIAVLQSGLDQAPAYAAVNPIRTHATFPDGRRNPVHLLAYIREGWLLLEIEPRTENEFGAPHQFQFSQSIQRIQQAPSPGDLFQIAATEVKSVTGFDRVMVYRFDEDDHGEVIAEAREERLEPYLGLHYPASDIPRQARDLYKQNQVRMIVDILAQPARILSSVGESAPINLSDVANRGVSPIHIEYLDNIGVRASTSIAIIQDDKLWGLFACHHYQPKFIDVNLRNFCRFLGQIFSGHLSLFAATALRENTLRTSLVRSRLFEQMSVDWDIVQGLTTGEHSLLDLTDCGGACIFLDGMLTCMGNTPSEAQVRRLVDWLADRRLENLYQTNYLAGDYPPATEFVESGAGLLSVRLSPSKKDFLLWFKPEVIHTVTWAGKPDKILSDDGLRLCPRKSFDKWAQQVNHRSLTWPEHEGQAALALRNNIKDVVMERYQQVRRNSEELEAAYNELESFSYSVSHDLRAPLRGIDGFAQILMEDYHDKLDEYGKEVVRTIISNSAKMNGLINDILRYSRLGSSQMTYNELSLPDIVKSELPDLLVGKQDRRIDIRIQDNMPPVWSDEVMIRQIIVNLISNAIKYTAGKPVAVIEIGGERLDAYNRYFVRDNGIGMDMKYADRIFGVFSRLVAEDEYEGTGVGLAIVKRIIDKHGGRIWVESEPEEGTTFFFQLPARGEVEEPD